MGYLQVIATGAAAWFVMLLGLYGTKAVLHPRKVVKEWQCPMRSNSFSVPFITIMLFAYVLDGQFEHSHKMAQVMAATSGTCTWAL